MLHSLAARVILMASETADSIVENPTLISECIDYVLRNMPTQLRTTLAFNIQIEVMSVIYDCDHMDFGDAKEFPPRPVDNMGYHFGL